MAVAERCENRKHPQFRVRPEDFFEVFSPSKVVGALVDHSIDEYWWAEALFKNDSNSPALERSVVTECSHIVKDEIHVVEEKHRDGK